MAGDRSSATCCSCWRAAPLAAGFAWNEAEASAAHDAGAGRARGSRPAGAATPFTPKFFTAHEYETVRLLVDLIIPRDERSGSATDAGVPEFMDFILIDEPRWPRRSPRQTAMRGGLAWLDLECQRRFDKTFVACTRRPSGPRVLDDISQPPPPSRPDGSRRADERADAAGPVARPRVLQQLPRSHRDRLLDERRWAWRTCSSWATASWRSGTAARTRR